MKITGVVGREIYDCRGLPTIECTLVLENNEQVYASVPAGVSKGSSEAFELRDGGTRLLGMGVNKALEIIEHTIAPELIGKEPNVILVDAHLQELDDTENKSRLGANTMLAVSMAVARAQALCESMPLYELIARLCNLDSVALPFPMFNLINGGAHANNNLQIQEFMVMPISASSFHAAMEIGATIHLKLKELLENNGKSTAVGIEGGFSPDFDNEFEAFDYIMQAIEAVQTEYETTIMICLDIAATQFYNPQTKLYHLRDEAFETQELIDWYKKLCDTYPIYSLEDPLSENDWEGWKLITQQMTNKVQLVGDDIFVTNPNLIWKAVDEQIAHSAIIKPNQIGTLTETLQAALLCKEHGINIIASHRSAETNDSFIADLAVGVSAGQIKTGGLSRGERMAKYNRLLKIEDGLMLEQPLY